MTGAWEHAWGFLSWLFADWREDAPIRFHASRGKQRRGRWARNREELRHVTVELLELNADGWHVFVQPNPCRAVCAPNGSDWGGRKENVAYVHVLMLDWDVEKRRLPMPKILDKMREAGIRLHALVRSGYGQHGYIRLAELCCVEDVEPIARRVCGVFLSDPVGNANRIMRLPGTVNWKNDGSRLCYVEGVRVGPGYLPASIVTGMDQIGAPRGDPPTDDWEVLGAELASIGDAPDLAEVIETFPDFVRHGMLHGTLPNDWVDRSKYDFAACCAFVKAGLTNAQIGDIYSNTAIAYIKAAEAGVGYLRRTVEAARKAVLAEIQVLPDTLQALVDDPDSCWYVAEDGSVQYNMQRARELVHETMGELLAEAEAELQASKKRGIS